MNCNPVTIGEAVSAAWKRMIQVLFRPFDLTKWITWGFCIWVISCSSGKSGGSGNFPTGKTHSSGTVHSGGADSFWPKLDQLLNGTDGSFFDRMCRTFHWEPATVTLVLSLIAVLVLFGIAIAVVLLWLRGRFEFMWLHNTVRNCAEIKAPWREYRREGNSFFKGWFLISLTLVLASLFLAVLSLIPVYRWIKASAAAHEALPFHFQELEARIRSLTRRKFVQEDVCLKWNQLTFDTRTREASVNGVPLSLTRKESSLLEYFLLHQNRVISPEEMIEHIWDGSVNTFSNSIRVHISSLRKKLKAAIGFDPIQNKIGQGYILEEYR